MRIKTETETASGTAGIATISDSLKRVVAGVNKQVQKQKESGTYAELLGDTAKDNFIGMPGMGTEVIIPFGMNSSPMMKAFESYCKMALKVSELGFEVMQLKAKLKDAEEKLNTGRSGEDLSGIRTALDKLNMAMAEIKKK